MGCHREWRFHVSCQFKASLFKAIFSGRFVPGRQKLFRKSPAALRKHALSGCSFWAGQGITRAGVSATNVRAGDHVHGCHRLFASMFVVSVADICFVAAADVHRLIAGVEHVQAFRTHLEGRSHR